MNHTLFISSRLKTRRTVVAISIAVSYVVMIVAMAVSAGFRQEIRNGVAEIGGDVQLSPLGLNILEDAYVETDSVAVAGISAVDGVVSVEPVIYRAGIVKASDNIHGVILKGVPSDDTVALAVSIPERLARVSGLKPGDRMLTYFVGEKVKARSFNVSSVYQPVVEADQQMSVYADVHDLRRLYGWNENQASMMEVTMAPSYRSPERLRDAALQMGGYGMYASPSVERYPQLFDWLGLLDFNVIFILVLMMIVAGFNMVSGLLITLFENISTIGIFKSMGMTARSISMVFLASSASVVLKGMAAGNIIAVVICLLQDKFHIMKLDPVNYFVSFVPVDMSFTDILVLDVVSFVLIMVILLIPCRFIYRVDPAETVKVR